MKSWHALRKFAHCRGEATEKNGTALERNARGQRGQRVLSRAMRFEHLPTISAKRSKIVAPLPGNTQAAIEASAKKKTVTFSSDTLRQFPNRPGNRSQKNGAPLSSETTAASEASECRAKDGTVLDQYASKGRKPSRRTARKKWHSSRAKRPRPARPARADLKKTHIARAMQYATSDVNGKIAINSTIQYFSAWSPDDQQNINNGISTESAIG